MTLRTLVLTFCSFLWTATAWAALEVNKAKEAELDGVRGLGPALTQRILQEREKALFRDWADFIRRIPGIGPARAAQLSGEGLTVDGQSYQVPGSAPMPMAPALPKAPPIPAAPPMPPMPPKPPLPAAPQS